MSNDARLRYAELFAGAGGLSLGLDRAGLSCAWHAELADFPRRVLKHRWPDVPLYGDVSELDGHALVAEHGPIDMLTGGSPCQDMSVAGKRAGLAGARSGLFYQQLRLWEETNATYLLWENVAGALSSNSGKDFAAVLSAIVGATVTVPRDGWGGDESGGGVAAGPRAVAAWRLLDAQWFGVPQRRLRVFVLGARAGGVDPAEVLLEPQGVRRNPPTRGEAREGTARGAGDGVGEARGVTLSFKSGQSEAAGATFVTEEFAPTLQAQNNGSTAVPAVLAFHQTQDPISGAECSPALGTTSSGMGVLAFAENQRGELRLSALHPQLTTGGGKPGQGYPAVVAFNAYQRTVSDVASPLMADDAKKVEVGVIALDVQNCIASDDVFASIDTGAAKGNRGPQVLTGIPRRLMPIECERLMGWPDSWTDVPDEKGKPASDAARYKACGNGVVSHVPEWIARRLLALESAAEPKPTEAA